MKEYIDSEILILQSFNVDEPNAASSTITDCKKRSGTIYTIGNGEAQQLRAIWSLTSEKAQARSPTRRGFSSVANGYELL